MKIIDFEVRGNCVRFYLGRDEDEDYTGDDWNDSPYDCNAGHVYRKYITGYAEIVFPMDTLVLEPCNGVINSRFSKNDMKNGIIPCVVVVPAVYADQEYDETFPFWCNHRKAHKFFFGDRMDPTIGPAIYYFNPKLDQFLEDVTTRMVTRTVEATISGCSPMNVLPIWEKANLTLKEASQYFSISETKLRELTFMPDCPFLLVVGRKRLIKRKQLEHYLENVTSI